MRVLPAVYLDLLSGIAIKITINGKSHWQRDAPTPKAWLLSTPIMSLPSSQVSNLCLD